MTMPAAERWAASGAMAITGPPDTPLGPPAGLVEAVADLGAPFAELDPVALLAERAALMGLWRRGATSCGGSCRLVAAGDGRWLGVSLPRPDDVSAVPAWLELDGAAPAPGPALWTRVAETVAGRDAAVVLERALLLGLPVSLLGEASGRAPVVQTDLGPAPPRDLAGLLVVDLSALWAGPLCADLLARAGADVVKVESLGRPDGARRGPVAFFDLLNGTKRSVALDFASPDGRGALHALVEGADVVVEASRPRALEQLGIVAADLVGGGGPQVWVSITGHGRGADRIAFGDDAAVAGGLVAWHEALPFFCADAVGDPLSGLTAARACLDALARGGRTLLDVSMSAVCASFAGPTCPVPPDVAVALPQARPPAAPAHPAGADTAEVLSTLGVTRW